MFYLAKILDYYRVKDWFYHLGFIYLGMVYISGSYAVPLKAAITGFILGSLYLGGGYAYNKLCDSQEINKLRLFYPLGCHAIFVFLGGYYLKENNIFFVIAVFLNILYSHPKYLLKKRHNLRVLLNGYFFGALFLLGCLIISGRLDMKICMMTAFFILVMYPYEIIHEISHFESDKVEYSAGLVRQYIRQIYFFLFLSSMAAYVLYSLLKLNISFAASALLFNIAFFIIVLHMDKREQFKATEVNKIRSSLKYLGMFYGVLLGVSFIK